MSLLRRTTPSAFIPETSVLSFTMRRMAAEGSRRLVVIGFVSLIRRRRRGKKRGKEEEKLLRLNIEVGKVLYTVKYCSTTVYCMETVI